MPSVMKKLSLMNKRTAAIETEGIILLLSLDASFSGEPGIRL